MRYWLLPLIFVMLFLVPAVHAYGYRIGDYGGETISTATATNAIAINTVYANYNDISFTNITYNSSIFFSTAFINDTKYFLISCQNDNITVSKLDDVGVFENNISQNFTCAAVSNSLNLFYWSNEQILFTTVLKNGSLQLAKFNLTDYITGNTGISLIGEIDTGVSANNNYLSVSSFVAGGVYGTDYVTNDQTIGVTYKKGSDYYVSWDFYDIESQTWTAGTQINTIFSTGIGSMEKTFIRATNNNCFNYDDCLFQILFKGTSNQNGGRTGIYIREMNKGTFGWNYKDKGLIGYTTSTGFETWITDINYWYYSNQYNFLDHKIYIDATTPSNNRVWANVLYDINWLETSEYRLNDKYVQGLQPYSEKLTMGGFTNAGCGSLNVSSYNITNTNSSYIYISGYLDTNGNGFTASAGVLLKDTNNSNNRYSIKFDPAAVVGNINNNYFYAQINNINASYIDIIVNVTCAASGYGISQSGSSIFLDLNLFDSADKQDIQITQDLTGETEAYLIHNYPSSSPCLFYNTNSIGIQTVGSRCICTDFSYICTDASTTTGTRACAPTNCAPLTTSFTNTSCAGTTTIGEYVTQEQQAAIDAAKNEPLIEGWPAILSLFNVFIVGILGAAGYIEYKTKTGGIAFCVIIIMGLIIGTYYNIVPLWIAIVLGLLAAAISAMFIRNSIIRGK